MARPIISISLEGEEKIQQAFKEAPVLANRYVRQVWVRSGKRWRKSFKRSQLGGRPGIKAPKMQKVRDKNATTFVSGKFEGLGLFYKISRFLRWHTEGADIPKRGGGGTFHLPGRLKFKQTVSTQVPPTVQETGSAALRAMRVALERRSRR